VPPVSTWSEAIFDLNGRPLPGTAVTIYTDVAGTILAPVFTDANGTTPQPNSTYTTVAVGDPTFEPGNLTVYAPPGSYIGRALGQNRIFPVVVPVSGAQSSTFLTGLAPMPSGGDDLAALTAALAVNKEVTLIPGGTYLLSAQLPIPANATLKAARNARLSPLTPGAPPTFMVTAAGDGAGMQGVIVTGSTAYGMHVANFNNVKIFDNWFSQIDGYAVLIEGACASTRCRGNVVKHTTAGKGQGLTAKVNGGVPIDTTYIDNTVDVLGVLGLEMQLGVTSGSISGNTVRNCNIGISVSGSTGVAVTGNTVNSCTISGIEIAASNNNPVVGNTVNGNGITATGIIVDNAGPNNNSIVANTVKDCVTHSVFLSGSTNVGISICANVLRGSSQPIYLQNSSACSVTGNDVDGLGVAGSAVQLDTCHDLIVTANTFNACTMSGVNAYYGTMLGIIIGPNILSGGTPADLINGPLGAGSRVIRGNIAPAGLGAITVTPSPFTYTNADQGQQLVYVLGGTVSAIAKNGLTLASGTSATMPVPVWLEPLEAVTVTYTVVPTMQKDRK